jgi:hypothetical protein
MKREEEERLPCLDGGREGVKEDPKWKSPSRLNRVALNNHD